MAASIAVPILKDATLYGEGNSLLGKVKEFELPTIEHEFVDHEAVGMKGVVQLFSGTNPMEGTFTFYYDPEIVRLICNPMKSVNLQVRANLNIYTSAGESTVPVVIFLRGRFKTTPMGSFVQNENTELEADFTADAVRVSIDNQDLYEIDITANIYKVAGTDILSTLTNLLLGAL